MRIAERIDPETFESIDIRTGTVRSARPLPEARHPAWLMEIDFGPEMGILRSSARITKHYMPDDLVDRQILAVVNLGDRQIGKVMSQCLVLGFQDENNDIILASTDRTVPDGSRLF